MTSTGASEQQRQRGGLTADEVHIESTAASPLAGEIQQALRRIYSCHPRAALGPEHCGIARPASDVDEVLA